MPYTKPKHDILYRLGYVYFSVLTMKTNIRGHCGVTNAKLRIQLPVVLETAADGSSQGSYISIAGENHQYELHKPIIFDDSYTHAVTNYHTERAVLIIDIWHPRWVMFALFTCSQP
ncbi:hypothetical protein EON65_14985 [archaeon]|nr:MAG: hypothetical protein EON65_14985 [archaeon]